MGVKVEDVEDAREQGVEGGRLGACVWRRGLVEVAVDAAVAVAGERVTHEGVEGVSDALGGGGVVILVPVVVLDGKLEELGGGCGGGGLVPCAHETEPECKRGVRWVQVDVERGGGGGGGRGGGGGGKGGGGR